MAASSIFTNYKNNRARKNRGYCTIKLPKFFIHLYTIPSQEFFDKIPVDKYLYILHIQKIPFPNQNLFRHLLSYF